MTLMFWVAAKLEEETRLPARPSMNPYFSVLHPRTLIRYDHSLGQELAFIKANSNSIVGFSVWAAGAFDTTYVLTVTPNLNGTDQPLWVQASEWFVSCLNALAADIVCVW